MGDESHHNLQVPYDPAFFSQRLQQRPRSPHPEEEEEEDHFFASPSRPPTLRDIDIRNGIIRSPSPSAATHQQQPAMTTVEQQMQQLRDLAEVQQQTIMDQQKQMDEAGRFANIQTQQLQESKRQLEASQRSIDELTAAFREMSSHPRPLTLSSAPKKKPDLPPFDSKNVLVWIRRVEAAYSRVGVIEPRDKFAWMESIFQVKLDPQIDAYLYGTNTAQEWDDFINYLKLQYGPTIKQKTQKLMGENPRHDLRPSQYLIQLKEDVKDVTIDHILKEHLLKSVPPRIREILGKEVETLSSAEVAKKADDFFDRQGKPIEKYAAPISQVSTATSSSSTASASNEASPPFTSPFSDEEADINQVRRGGFRGNDRGRSRNRGQRSQSRPAFGRSPNSSSTGNNSSSSNNNNNNDSKPSFPQGMCKWHKRFGDKSLKCVTDCPRFKSFSASQQSGNGQGGRRM